MVLCHAKLRLGIAAAGSLVLSAVANVLADPPRESGEVTNRSCFRNGGGERYSPNSRGRAGSLLSLYTIYELLQISLMHLRPDMHQSGSQV